MTFLNATINNLNQTILYHQQQIEETQNQLDQVKLSQAYGEEAVSSVEEAIENINPEHLELLKEHLLSLFETQTQSIVPQERTVETPKEVEPSAKGQEDTQKTRAKLLGIPDFTPTTYEDLAPNISYSSDGRAYVGFNDYSEAEKFRDSISEPSMIDDAVIMNGFKHEVKFHCSKEYIQEIANSMSEEVEEVQKPNFEKIDSEIIYNHTDSIAYLAFSAKGRADNYGSYLTRILDIGEKYTVSKTPSMFDSKYELRLEDITFEDALHLQSFNLKKDWNSPVNEEARELWRDTRKREVEPACKPLPKLASIEEINLGEIVYLNSHSTQYKVLQKVNYGGVPHLEVICVFNLERLSLVGATSYLKEAYRVLADDIQIDPQFPASSLRLKDEAPRSSTQEKQEAPKVEVVKEKPKPILKTKELSEGDFPIGPYRRISLDDIEVSDVVSTGANIKGYYEIYQHNGDHVLGRCLYHDSLKMRIGQDGYYIKDAYLVEKAEASEVALAA